jgi:hypothetical protein
MKEKRGYRESLSRAGERGRIRAARNAIYRKWAGGNKYGAVKTLYGGVLYDSKLEAHHAEQLDLLKKTATKDYRVRSWKRQVPIKLEVNGVLVTTYIVDFVVTYWDGHEELHEVKGLETETWRLKEKLFRALFPDRRLVIVRR